MKSSRGERSKNIHINPLMVGGYALGKYTNARGNCGVTDSTAAPRGDKIHYNPKFLAKETVHVNPKYLKNDVNYLSTLPATTRSIHVNPNFIGPSYNVNVTSSALIDLPKNNENTNKYKFVRKNQISSEKVAVTTEKPPQPETSSKYKLVYSSAHTKPTQKTPTKSSGVVMKSKYSLRVCQPNSYQRTVLVPPTGRPSTKRLSLDFQRISRTKLVRKTLIKNQQKSRKRLSSSSKPRKSLQLKSKSPSIYRFSAKTNEFDAFKTLTRTKIVRCSVLRAQIDARRLTKRNFNSSFVLQNQHSVKSKYKLVLKTPQRKALATEKFNRKFSKLKKNKLTIASFTSKLRKNNQRCMFYNRFGRCKGKDRGTCNQIHDPLYVAVCKKLPFGECSDKTCRLSHDTRPGKMPTCYHYLAGVCQRDNCPFLHIKVSPKAPICRSFLQGFCPDIFNCLKRHEYICPNFAEKGTCPKGKSCAHPHKIPNIISKLLSDDQIPLVTLSSEATSKKPSPKTTKMSISHQQDEKPAPKTTHQTAFTRYFSVALPSNPCDPSNEDIS